MPVVRINYQDTAGWFAELTQSLVTIVGPVLSPDCGDGWRFQLTQGPGPQRLHWQVGGGPHGKRLPYYLIEIDDPKLATFFALKHT